jgi:AcrR family transcriptional regulator
MGSDEAMVKATSNSSGKKTVGHRLTVSGPSGGFTGEGQAGSQTASPAPQAFAKWVRGADADRRAAILDTADDVFLEVGFQAASMSEIAARLGGSKGTLYNYFPSKEDLFIACVQRHCESFRAQMSALIEAGGDFQETLTRVGRRYVEFVGSDETVRKFRMIVAEADRAPELTRAFYETGPARGAASLAAYLESTMESGLLMKTDAVSAAQIFLNLCQNRLFKARLCNAEQAPTEAAIKRDVAEAVRIFMAAYGAPKQL